VSSDRASGTAEHLQPRDGLGRARKSDMFNHNRLDLSARPPLPSFLLILRPSKSLFASPRLLLTLHISPIFSSQCHKCVPSIAISPRHAQRTSLASPQDALRDQISPRLAPYCLMTFLPSFVSFRMFSYCSSVPNSRSPSFTFLFLPSTGHRTTPSASTRVAHLYITLFPSSGEGHR